MSQSLRSACLGLGLGVCALVFSTSSGSALDVAGVITINGYEAPDIVIAPYDCATGAFLPEGFIKTVPTQVINGVRYNFSLSVNADNVRLELYYGDCRGFVSCADIVVVDGKAYVTTNIQCNLGGPGTATIGYWAGHSGQWPVDVLTIGGITYGKPQIIQILNVKDSKDKTRTLFAQLVAAKLNVAAGNFAACITADIAAADAWMKLHPVGSHILASSPSWGQISATSLKLDQYNYGLLCALPMP